MQALEQRLGGVPGPVALGTLAGAKARRRQVAGLLCVLLGTRTLALASRDGVPRRR
jgi:hypothetical protein